MKTPNIRFNLEFYDTNGNVDVVRTLDDLREKCNLSDLCDYYESGVLERWLSSIGHAELAQRLPVIAQGSYSWQQIDSVLQELGIEVPEQVLSDFAHVQERKRWAKSDSHMVQNQHADAPSFITLISVLFKISERVGLGATVEDMQKIERDALPTIRQLIKCHEASFLQFIERSIARQRPMLSLRSSRLWWVLLVLYSNPSLREYMQFAFECDVRFAGDSGTHLNVFVLINDHRERAGSVIGFDESNMSAEKFCEEKFGWSLDD